MCSKTLVETNTCDTLLSPSFRAASSQLSLRNARAAVQVAIHVYVFLDATYLTDAPTKRDHVTNLTP